MCRLLEACWVSNVVLCLRVNALKQSRNNTNMMTSSNGNIFHVTGSLCGEFTGHRWIPLTKASDKELWCFLWSEPWINGWVNNREAGDLRCNRARYDATVMNSLHVFSKLYSTQSFDSWWPCDSINHQRTGDGCLLPVRCQTITWTTVLIVNWTPPPVTYFE